MSRSQLLWMLLLIVLVLFSGVGVSYAKYQSRILFIELQKLREATDAESREWGRLQLELASQGSLEDVMRAARERLRMRVPDAAGIVVVD